MRQTAVETPRWLTESRTASRYCVSDKPGEDGGGVGTNMPAEMADYGAVRLRRLARLAGAVAGCRRLRQTPPASLSGEAGRQGAWLRRRRLRGRHPYGATHH